MKLEQEVTTSLAVHVEDKSQSAHVHLAACSTPSLNSPLGNPSDSNTTPFSSPGPYKRKLSIMQTGFSPDLSNPRQVAFRYRYRKPDQVETIIIPNSTNRQAKKFYNQHLRALSVITPTKLQPMTDGNYQTTTPRQRVFKPIENTLPNVMSFGTVEHHVQVLQHDTEQPEKMLPTKRKRIFPLDQETIKARLPDPPDEPFKLVIFKIDCTQQRDKDNTTVMSNNRLMNYIPATNQYTHSVFKQNHSQIDTLGELGSVDFEHTHLSANHFKRYACIPIAGQVDPSHPDDVTNLTQAPKTLNSHMMAAELLVDALFDKVHGVYNDNRIDAVAGVNTENAWQNITTEHQQFDHDFNHAALHASTTEIVVGVLARLQEDENDEITHNANTIYYFIAWNRECISFRFQTNVCRTPALTELQCQRDYLAPLFEKYFATSHLQAVTLK